MPASVLIKIILCGSLLLLGCKSQQLVTQEKHLTDLSNALSSENATVTDELEQTEVVETAIKSEEEIHIKSSEFERDVETTLKRSSVFSSHLTGFSLFDMTTEEFLVNHNANMNFTPASNTKILTMYAVLRSFGKKIPGAIYYESKDTLFIRPTGDPTFLHPKFTDQPLLFKIQNTPKPVTILWPKVEQPSFGIGWMWDDYGTSFQPELSWLPLYGNVVRFSYSRAKITAEPELFENLIEVVKGTENTNSIRRSFGHNHFEAEIRYPNWSFEKSIPFKYSHSLAAALLKNATNHSISIVPERKMSFDTLFSVATDTVLRLMMQSSDNFLAEQLLIMAAWKNGFDNSEDFREFVISKWLNNINPIWKDGSGLSRYNLIKPNENIQLLRELYQEFGWARIHNLFAHGGKSGTLKDWYPNRLDPANPSAPIQPYIIAKSGTLSNIYNLSGYLQTRSGKLLAFSFMNNNFVRPTSEVRKEMQLILEKVRDTY